MFAEHSLFDRTLPIYSAGKSGNGSMVFFNIAVRLKNKGTSAANVRDHNLTLAMFPVTFHWSPTLKSLCYLAHSQ
jgi:hypothetical protein